MDTGRINTPAADDCGSRSRHTRVPLSQPDGLREMNSNQNG
ncbi:hypothetical protein FB570_11164 [Streptomyces sp. T12]|nr:hypothetical protein FB570_11164 [Streptomyces sp. T12]